MAETTKPWTDRVERLPFAFENDRTEMWGTLDDMRKNGPGIVEHVQGMIIIDPMEPLMIP